MDALQINSKLKLTQMNSKLICGSGRETNDENNPTCIGKGTKNNFAGIYYFDPQFVSSTKLTRQLCLFQFKHFILITMNKKVFLLVSLQAVN